MGRIVSLIDRAVLPLPKLKKVAAYARVSCGKDDDSLIICTSQLLQPNDTEPSGLGVYRSLLG